MSCERYLDLISARMDGELTLLEESQLSAHLRSCPQCRAIAEDLKGIHSELSGMEPAPVPEELSRRVMEQIHAEQTARRTAARQRRRTVRQLAGLAACLALCVGVFRLTGFPSDNGLQMMNAPTERKTDLLAPVAETADAQANEHAAQSILPVEPPAAEPDHYFFCNDQYIRVDETVVEKPEARIVGSVESLNRLLVRFPNQNLSGKTGKYDADYFKTGRLLAVLLEENSGSIRHKIEEQGLLGDRVVIRRIVPEVGTCDMAIWLILAEVDSSFADGAVLQVETVNK